MKITHLTTPSIALDLCVLAGAVASAGRSAPALDLVAHIRGDGICAATAYRFVDFAVGLLDLGRDTEAPLAVLACGLWADLEELADCEV